MSSIDLTRPLSSLLRDSTRQAHDAAASSPGAKQLLSGQLPRDKYILYLMMLWHIYDAFELALDKHSTHPTLEPTYNPTLLARAPALSADISYLLQVEEGEWKTHPSHLAFLASVPSELQNYVSRIKELTNAEDPSRLLAHSYVRYMGDLSGGQTVRHTIAKAYDLDGELGYGVQFYAFKELRSAKPASQGEMKRIKDWFREGMDVGSEGRPEIKAAIVNESETAFTLNTQLFTVLEFKEDTLTLDVDRKSHLKNTNTTTFKVSQVLSVIAAVCLAHFILVVSGLTGENAQHKLLLVEQWLRAFWQSSDPESLS